MFIAYWNCSKLEPHIIQLEKHIAAVQCMAQFVSNVRLCNRHTNVNSH